MPTAVLPAVLAQRAGGASRIVLGGTTVGAALSDLERLHPPLRGWILDERGRIREHVNVFLGDVRTGVEQEVRPSDELYVLQAISGGLAASDGPTAEEDEMEILAGTKKGLLILQGPRGGLADNVRRRFAGQVVEYAMRDHRSGRYFASVTHGQFGPHVYWTDDLDGEWTQADGPVFPEATGATVTRTWVIEPGAADGVLWAGVAPAALFRSEDGGESWRLVDSLWNQPSRATWEGGFGGLCLHSICPWPGDDARIAVAGSAFGVWLSDDACRTWRTGIEGLVPRYLPEEARAGTLMHCVHKLRRAPLQPTTLYLQFHGGVYRSDDAGESWSDIGTGRGLPSDFGFPLAIDAHDPDRAFVIPLVADFDRVSPEGRMRVYETTDRGASWTGRGTGLPAENAYLTVLRQAFAGDDQRPLGLAFGTESGEVFASDDGGMTWRSVARHLPPILSIALA